MNLQANWKKIYSFVFVLVTFIMLAGQLLVPGITVSTISKDFLWRESLVENYRKLKYTLGDKVYPNAVIGKEGWIFHTENLSLRNYQKYDPLGVSNIKTVVRVLGAIDEKVKAYGGTFLVVIPPDKSTVYPQYMPDEIPVIGDVTSLDRLIDQVNNSPDIQLIDLRPVLINASEESLVYYKTDTHWNCIGAYYAYEEILFRLAGLSPEFTVHSINDFTITDSPGGQLDLAKMIEVDTIENFMSATPKFSVEISQYPNPFPEYETLQMFVNDNTELPGLIIFHDSFYPVCLDAYLKPAFGRTISMPYSDIELSDMLKLIEVEQPKVVILEFAERLLEELLWHLSE